MELAIPLSFQDFLEDYTDLSTPQEYKSGVDEDGKSDGSGTACVVQALEKLGISVHDSTPDALTWHNYCEGIKLNYKCDAGAYILYKSLGFEVVAQDVPHPVDVVRSEPGNYLILIKEDMVLPSKRTVKPAGHAVAVKYDGQNIKVFDAQSQIVNEAALNGKRAKYIFKKNL